MTGRIQDTVSAAAAAKGYTRRALIVHAGKGAAVLAAGAGLSTVFDACGGASAPSSSHKSSAGKGPVTGSIAFSWWGTGERNAKTEAVMSLFQKKYPNATIQGTPVGDFNTYWEKLTVEAAAHNLPDVIQMQVGYLSAYDTRHALMPLDSLVESGAINISGIPKAVTDVGRGPDDKLYMISTGAAGDCWGYNETMAQKAGLGQPAVSTWSDLQRWLIQAKDKLPNGVYACDLQGGDADVWRAWMASHGSTLFNKDGTKLAFSKELMIEYWNWWETLRKAGATVPAALSAEEPTSNAQAYLATGQVMFSETPSNQLAAKQAPLTAAGKGTLKLAPFPRAPKGNGMTLINNGMSIAANTSNLAAAAAWINFFTNDPQGAQAYASDNGVVTVSKLLNTQIAQASALPAGTQEYLQFMKNAIAQNPKILNFPANLNAVILSLTNNYQNVSFGKASVESAVNSFFSQAATAVSQ